MVNEIEALRLENAVLKKEISLMASGHWPGE